MMIRQKPDEYLTRPRARGRAELERLLASDPKWRALLDRMTAERALARGGFF